MLLYRRRPPTLAERLLGRKRVKQIRRRLGYAALGTGFSLLKPPPPWGVVCVVAVIAFPLAVMLV